MTDNLPMALNDEPLIGVDEAANILGLKRATVYAHTSHRTIPHYKRHGKLYFRRSELIEWLTEGRRPVIDDTTAVNHIRSNCKRGV